MALPGWLSHLFKRYAVNYTVYAQHTAGARAAKTVFLTANSRPVAVVVPADECLDLHAFTDVIGEGTPRRATEEETQVWFPTLHYEALPPLRLREDQALLMDRSLATSGKITIATGVRGSFVSIAFRDWYRVARPGVGRFILSRARVESRRPVTILVVEDEAVTNMMLCRLLEKEGYICRGAKDGRGALALATELRPAAILLDVMLPDMSGFDVCAKLRQGGPLKHIPVIVLTALDDDGTREDGWQLGADAFLTKPVCPETLVAELDRVLADARA